MRRHLLGPLIGRVHRQRPANGVVVVRVRGSESPDVVDQELVGLDLGHTVEIGHLVEGAADRPLGRSPVVTDDVEDEGVVEDSQVLEGADETTYLDVRVLQEAGIDLHLSLQDRLELVVHLVPRRDLGRPGGQFGIGPDDPQLLLSSEDLLPQRVPAL